MTKSIVVDGVEYVPASGVKNAKKLKGLEYKIVRTYSAGVFAGYLSERKGGEGKVLNARRLWKWSGASSLSQLSQEGVKNPDDCKFPCEVPEVELTEIIEVLPCTESARISISSVPVWKQ